MRSRWRQRWWMTTISHINESAMWQTLGENSSTLDFLMAISTKWNDKEISCHLPNLLSVWMATGELVVRFHSLKKWVCDMTSFNEVVMRNKELEDLAARSHSWEQREVGLASLVTIKSSFLLQLMNDHKRACYLGVYVHLWTTSIEFFIHGDVFVFVFKRL